MRCIVLGGAGYVGREVVKDLAGAKGLKEVSVADFNATAAKRLADQVGRKASARFVDITDAHGLLEAVKGYDVAVNTVGPFYRNGSRVLEACLKARVHYVDVCDDYDAADELLRFDKRCKKAGITAIPCCGASPGITNMLGLLGASKMDHAKEIHTSWVENIADAGGVVVWWHGVHMAHGEVPQFIDGKWVKVPALSGRQEVRFADPLGSYPVYFLGHPEPVTLPRYIKGLKVVTNKGNICPQEADLMNIVKPYSDLGLTGTETVAIGGDEIVMRDFLLAYMRPLLEADAPPPAPGDPHFLLRVDVKGTMGGSEVQFAFTGHMKDTSEATGLSASFGAQTIASGKISKRGVIAPEGCLDPKYFFKYLADRGIRFSETKTITQTQPLRT